MEFVLSELTKYFALLFGALYAFSGCVSFTIRSEKIKNWCYGTQKLLLFLVQFLCYCNMGFQTKNVKFVLLYGAVQVLLFTILSVTPLVYEKVNRQLLNNMCFLLGIGFIIISRLSFAKAIRQLLIAGVGFLISLFIPVIIAKWKWLSNCWLIYGSLGIGALLTVFILGEVTYGSKISFSIWGITFQPSEFVKILFVFCIASLLFTKTNAFRIVLSAAIGGAYVLVLAASKDLGAALIMAAAYIIMLFLAANSYILLLAGMIAATAGSIGAYYLFPHIQYRVVAWQDPLAYIEGSGYQIAQSAFAIASGGLFGTGLFKGNPKAIPYVEDDMIFSAICEEMGILFGIVVIVVCYLSFFTIIQIGIRTRNQFHKLVCAGLATAYAVQTFLTIGGGIKFIPLTGVTLPLVSYGGSSVMATIMVFFIVQGIHIGHIVDTRVTDEGQEDGEEQE